MTSTHKLKLTMFGRAHYIKSDCIFPIQGNTQSNLADLYAKQSRKLGKINKSIISDLDMKMERDVCNGTYIAKVTTTHHHHYQHITIVIRGKEQQQRQIATELFKLDFPRKPHKPIFIISLSDKNYISPIILFLCIHVHKKG